MRETTRATPCSIVSLFGGTGSPQSPVSAHPNGSRTAFPHPFLVYRHHLHSGAHGERRGAGGYPRRGREALRVADAPAHPGQGGRAARGKAQAIRPFEQQTWIRQLRSLFPTLAPKTSNSD